MSLMMAPFPTPAGKSYNISSPLRRVRALYYLLALRATGYAGSGADERYVKKGMLFPREPRF